MFDKFSSGEIISIITALAAGIGVAATAACGVVTAIGGVIVLVINALGKKVDKVIAGVEEAKATVVEAKENLAMVATEVNSKATAYISKIDALQAQIGGMHLEMAKREQIAALLAQQKLANGIVSKSSHGDPFPVTEENHPSNPVPTTEE